MSVSLSTPVSHCSSDASSSQATSALPLCPASNVLLVLGDPLRFRMVFRISLSISDFIFNCFNCSILMFNFLIVRYQNIQVKLVFICRCITRDPVPLTVGFPVVSTRFSTQMIPQSVHGVSFASFSPAWMDAFSFVLAWLEPP